MRVLQILFTLALAIPGRYVLAQGVVTVSDKLPPTSVELRSHDTPATTTPWQLPKPDDRLYDADQEAFVKDFEHTHVVHVFERGVFIGYKTMTNGPLLKELAQEHRSLFVPNSKLPADAIELSADEHPDKSEYYDKRPEQRPANVPANCVPVKVFQGKTLIGWTYIPKEAVATLHQPAKTDQSSER